jgi:hypothetical protein
MIRWPLLGLTLAATLWGVWACFTLHVHVDPVEFGFAHGDGG